MKEDREASRGTGTWLATLRWGYGKGNDSYIKKVKENEKKMN